MKNEKTMMKEKITVQHDDKCEVSQYSYDTKQKKYYIYKVYVRLVSTAYTARTCDT